MHVFANQQRQPLRCVVCGAIAGPGILHDGAGALHVDQYPSCHAVACRMVVSRRADMDDAAFRHYLQLQVRQRQYQAERARLEAQQRLAEARANDAGWRMLRARLPASLEPPVLEVLLPTGPRQARKPGRGRCDRYRQHLRAIVAEARGQGEGAAAASGPAGAAEPDSALPGLLCATCGGGCCTRGGERAYLNAATMRRYMDAHPGLDDEAVVAAYLERVAARTLAGSCINHTARGCSLPREMRSDTCNRFACESLARVQAARREPQPVQVVLVVRRKQDHWRRAVPGLDNAVTGGAVLRETGVVRVPAAALRAAAAPAA